MRALQSILDKVVVKGTHSPFDFAVNRGTRQVEVSVWFTEKEGIIQKIFLGCFIFIFLVCSAFLILCCLFLSYCECEYEQQN